MKVYQVRRTVEIERPEDKGSIINTFKTWQEAADYGKEIFEAKNIESYITTAKI